MLSVELCRKLCPSLENLSDEEVIKVRENLYEGAQLGLEAWARENGGSKNLKWLLPNSNEEIP